MSKSNMALKRQPKQIISCPISPWGNFLSCYEKEKRGGGATNFCHVTFMTNNKPSIYIYFLFEGKSKKLL